MQAVIFKKALRRLVETQILRRGEEYYRTKRVKDFEIIADGAESITVSADVRGSQVYSVLLTWNPVLLEIEEAECTCPYKLGCKHIVAVGMHVVAWLEDFDTNGREPQGNEKLRDVLLTFIRKHYIHIASTKTRTAPTVTDTNTPPTNTLAGNHTEKPIQDAGADLAEKLRGINIDPSLLSPALLDILRAAQRPAATPAYSTHVSSTPTLTTTWAAQQEVFDAKHYFVHLDYDLSPTLRRRTVSYQTVSPKKILEMPGISIATRDLLVAIQKKVFDPHTHPNRDLRALVKLITKSDLVAAGNSYTFTPLSFEIAQPRTLQASLIRETKTVYEDISERILFVVDKKTLYGSVDYRPIVTTGSVVAICTKSTIVLHELTPILAKLFSRVMPLYGDTYTASASYGCELFGDELERYDEIVRDARATLTLTNEPPALTIDTSTAAQTAINVEYDAAGQTLAIKPVVDYGSLCVDVGESVYWSTAGGTRHLARRQQHPWEYPEIPHDYEIRFEGDTVHLAPIAESLEIKLFEAVTEHTPDNGFSKTAKCLVQGKSAIARFIKTRWAGLQLFATEQELPIRFTRDIISYASSTVQAQFTTNLNEEADWLRFDVECYCRGERITLEDIIAFIRSGDTLMHRPDGTLLHIENRAELERLASLLASFEQREGMFEGHLHHAPELSYVMTSSPHYDASRAKSIKQFMHKIEKGKPLKKIKLPKIFSKVLRPYQTAGVEWLYFLRSYRFAGILADDMGLGKTLQTLALLSAERVKGKPSIVVCPTSLVHNWAHEAEKFAPDLRVLAYHGTPDERTTLAKEIRTHDLIIVSYTTLRKDEQVFIHDKMRFNYAVLDEAQYIKNHATKGAQLVKKIHADYRLALTGTPIENTVSELWSVFDFLMPKFLGTYDQFSKRFHKPIMEQGDQRAMEHLRAKIAPFMLRRTKSEVLTELPKKIEQTITTELTDAQSVLYQNILAKVRGEVFAAVGEKGFNQAQIHILAGLTKLRQVCNHPALLTDKKATVRDGDSAKLDLAMELITEAAAGGHKVLLFSQFTGMLDIVAETLDAHKITYCYLSGKTRNRQELIEQFNSDPNMSVFLISLKAGGVGLNLTAADTVIIFDPWWNPSAENQAADRAHRIGQTKTVTIYRLTTKGTIGERIEKLKLKKNALADALVGESKDLFKKLTWDDIRELFA